jgi:uncharacterized damage-inducible protein DinB
MHATHDVLEAWRMNHAINVRLIDAISAAGMRCTLSSRGGRDVARQFVHLHNVRWAWLSMAGPGMANSLSKLSTKVAPTKAQLKSAHAASCEGIGRWLARSLDEGVKMKNFAGGPYKALGYFLAHDAHHRGNILLTLKLSGHKIDTRTQYGIWMMWHNKKV